MKIFLVILALVSLVSCTKTITKENEVKPIYVKVVSEDNDGSLRTSEVIMVRVPQ